MDQNTREPQLEILCIQPILASEHCKPDNLLLKVVFRVDLKSGLPWFYLSIPLPRGKGAPTLGRVWPPPPQGLSRGAQVPYKPCASSDFKGFVPPPSHALMRDTCRAVSCKPTLRPWLPAWRVHLLRRGLYTPFQQMAYARVTGQDFALDVRWDRSCLVSCQQKRSLRGDCAASVAPREKCIRKANCRS